MFYEAQMWCPYNEMPSLTSELRHSKRKLAGKLIFYRPNGKTGNQACSRVAITEPWRWEVVCSQLIWFIGQGRHYPNSWLDGHCIQTNSCQLIHNRSLKSGRTVLSPQHLVPLSWELLKHYFQLLKTDIEIALSKFNCYLTYGFEKITYIETKC